MKKVLAISALVIGGLIAYGSNKASQITGVLSGLKIRVQSIRNIGFDLATQSVRFNVDVQLTNPDSMPLTINSAGAATLTRIVYHDSQNNLIGESFPDLTSINIPAYQSIIVPNVPTQIPIANTGLAVNAIINALSNPSTLRVGADINTPAGTFMIGN